MGRNTGNYKEEKSIRRREKGKEEGGNCRERGERCYTYTSMLPFSTGYT